MIPIDDEPDTSKFPFITITIIVVNVFVFIQELLSPHPDALIQRYALIPAHVNFSDVTTLTPFITSMFLHGGFMHIISNMLFLWIFGDNIEDVYGRVQFIFIYIISGVVAALTQYFFFPNAVVPMLGASGAIAGILGSYIVRFPGAHIKTILPLFPLFIPISVPAFLLIGFWFFTQVFNGLGALGINTAAGGIAWWAHVGGFIAGVILAYLLPYRRDYEAVEPE